jgi:hypothetical protein
MEAEMVATNKLADVEAQDDFEMDEETKKWRDMERTLTTRLIQGTAAASIVLNLVAMILEGGAAIAMGVIALAVGSFVIYFQFMLQDTDSKCYSSGTRKLASLQPISTASLC